MEATDNQSGFTHRRNKTPETQLHGNPAIRTRPFTDKLRRELCAKERELEHGVSEVIIWGCRSQESSMVQTRDGFTICGHSKVTEEIVGHGLVKIRPIKLQCHEHDTGKDHNAIVNLPDDLLLFINRPPS